MPSVRPLSFQELIPGILATSSKQSLAVVVFFFAKSNSVKFSIEAKRSQELKNVLAVFVVPRG